MANPGSPGNSAGKRKAYLLISLILLVWNTAAIARYAFVDIPPTDPFPPTSTCLPDFPSDNALARDNRVSASQGPLSLRQKFLLGKRVDINRATAEEISELPGISDDVAAAVVAERKRRGGFRSVRDLLSVRGIKKKRLENILPFLAKMENN